MISQKAQIMRSAYYLITADHAEVARKSPAYMGKLRSNLVGIEFNLYGEGENPKTKLPAEKIRNEYAAIVYKDHHLSKSHIRVIIPQVLDEYTYYVWKPLKVFLYIRL